MLNWLPKIEKQVDLTYTVQPDHLMTFAHSTPDLLFMRTESVWCVVRHQQQ